MPSKEASRLCDVFDWLKDSRRPFDLAAEDIQALMLPHKLEITTESNPGKQRIPVSYDSTATNAADALTNFLIGSVFPATADWLRLDLFMMEPSPEIRDRLDVASEKMLQVMDNSNFYEAAGSSLRDMWVLGNTTFYQEETLPDAEGALFGDRSGFSGMSFEAVQWSNMYRHLDRQGNTLVSCRVFNLSILEAIHFFGDNLKIKGDPTEVVKILHFYERQKDGTWKMSWLDKENENVIEQKSSLTINPYSSHRLDRVGNEQYGVGKGHVARPTAAGMNEMKRQLLNAVGRTLNAPLVVENEAVIRTERGSGGLVVLRESPSFMPFHLTPNYDITGVQLISNADTVQVERAFMSDILLDPQTQPRSAEESRLRQSRIQTRTAGPTQAVKRFLGAVVGNIASHMTEAGALDELKDLPAPVETTFSSPFFVAQRAGMIQKVIDFVQLKIGMAGAVNDPDQAARIIDDLDFDGVSAFLRRHADVPAIVFKDPDRVNVERRARSDIQGTREGLDQAAQLSQLLGSVPAQAPEGTIGVEGGL